MRNKLIFIFLIIFIILAAIPETKLIITNYRTSLKEVDEKSYENKTNVENTARSMIASYKADLDTYNAYKDATDKEKQSWGEQAKIRANRTARTYNEYILKNSHIWQENLPKDIYKELEIIN